MSSRLWLLVILLTFVAEGSTRAASSESERPLRRFDTRKLVKLHDPKLTAAERTNLGMGFLKEEISQPTDSFKGGGGGTIDHPYVMAQLVLALAQNGADRNLLWKEFNKAFKGEYRDALALTLGLAGDRRVVKYIVGYMLDTRNPMYLRGRAARALGEIRDPSTIPVMVKVLLYDPAYELLPDVRGPEPRIVKSYEVRRNAKSALRIMKRTKIDIGKEAEEAIRLSVVDEAVLEEPLID